MRHSQVISLLSVCGLGAITTLAQPCGNPWTLNPAAGPSARRYHAVTYDSARGKVVLFGGLSGSANLGDTWEWTAAGPGGGGSWLLRSTTGPSPRDHCGLAFDSNRQKTVLFGGATASGFSNQTWEWDGNVWTQIVPAISAPAMDASLMAYDPVRQRTVLVSTLGGAAAGRTWQYDGARWTESADSTPVALPGYGSLTHDPARSSMNLVAPYYGGYLNIGQATWERTATGPWTFRQLGALPMSLNGVATAFDPIRNQVVFVDSGAYSGQTSIWTWNAGPLWWTLVSSNGPAVAEGRSPVFDTAGGQLLLFGGRPMGGSGDLNETWLCRSDSRPGPSLSNLGPRLAYFMLGGSPGTLSVTGTGSGPIAYQWRLNQVELSDGGPFSGTHTPILTVNPTDIVYAGDYDAIVTDSCGSTFRASTHLLVTCYPNCDGSSSPPLLTSQDFQCYLTAYASGCLTPENCYANCDGSTAAPILNANDFQCYLNSFAAGCN